MKDLKEKALNGTYNKRLNNTDCTNNGCLSAWANKEKLLSHSDVSVPSEFDVIDSKDWVDNGSQL